LPVKEAGRQDFCRSRFRFWLIGFPGGFCFVPSLQILALPRLLEGEIFHLIERR
jgi:hypothetical protein